MTGDGRWGSDLLAEVLRDLDVAYVANVPGSSYRGLHDSIVNHLGNQRPELILTLHEETAVAIAHGYAKTTDRMMAAALHANIGLLRASMAVYNAWCDRAPVLLLGGTGPLDASQRRAVEWLHTSTDQAGAVRAFTKWDDQPASPAAAEESLLRAAQLAQTAPRGPVYVNVDLAVQEQALDPAYQPRHVARFTVPARAHPAPDATASAACLLADAARPVMLVGRCSRRVDDWDARVALAERLGAAVFTDLRQAAAFPTEHALHPVPPFDRWMPLLAQEQLRAADVILALDWPELAHTLVDAFGEAPVSARVIQASCDVHNHRGDTQDHGALAPSDVTLLCDADAAVAALLAALPETTVRETGPKAPLPRGFEPVAPTPSTDGVLSIAEVGRVVADAFTELDVCFTRFPFTWDTAAVQFRHPLDSIGYDGGSGLGSGPGITVGAGLALRGSDRLPVAITGDGDFLMGNTAIWTAAHYGIPCVFVVCNNRSFYTDERHQAYVANTRGRPVENQWIGSRLEGPDIDIAAIARAQGALGIGPVGDADSLRAALDDGVAAARAGGPAVIDVLVGKPAGAWPADPYEPPKKWQRLRRIKRRLR